MTMTLSSTIGRPSTMQDLQLKTKAEGLKLGSMESGVLTRTWSATRRGWSNCIVKACLGIIQGSEVSDYLKRKCMELQR
jgi:hypothetical protein